MRTSASADQRMRMCRTLDSSLLSRVGPNDIVYVTGPLSSSTFITDDEFRLQVPVARLWRRVELYQWQEEPAETVDKEGKTHASYSYSQVWTSTFIDSRMFRDQRHSNPRSSPFVERNFTARDTRIGVYRCDASLVSKLNDWQQLDLRSVAYTPPGSTRVEGSSFYSGDPASPRVGDVRISFFFCGITSQNSLLGQQDHASAIGGIRNDSIVPLQIDRQLVGKLVIGGEPKETLFAQAFPACHPMVWPLRAVGFFATWLSLFSMRAIIQRTIFCYLPLLSRMAQHAHVVFAALLAAIAVLCVSGFVWLSIRPFFSVFLYLCALLTLYIGIRTGGAPKRE